MSSRAFLLCLAAPDGNNITISAWFEKAHILDPYLAQIIGYISVYMPIHYLSMYLNSENKSFIALIPLDYQTGVFQRLGLF